MRFLDANFYQSHVIKWITQILLVFILVCNGHYAECLFMRGKEYTYSYSANSSSGVLLPLKAESSWGMHGELVIQVNEDGVVIQLQALRMHVQNGKLDGEVYSTGINDDANELLKPFQVTYKMGLIENFTTEAEPIWATNIKRNIAGMLQLNLDGLNKDAAFYSSEVNHYGQCTVEYVVSPLSDNEKLVRKAWDPRKCVGHPHRTWTNVPKMMCGNNEQNPVLKASQRVYHIRLNGEVQDILSVNATGDIYVQPFQNFGEAHYLSTKQSLELISIKDVTSEITMSDVHATVLQHELPEDDLTQGRSVPDKDTIFKRIGNLLDRLSQRLENPGLDTEVDNLHNTTISVLLYYLKMLDRVDLRTAYNKISGTSYKEETTRNMFLEALPQIGSKEAALFILELIQDKKVSDIAAIQLLTHLPFHVRKPDVQLLVSLQSLLSLPSKIALEVQNTAILMYGTLIYKTCLLYCPYEMLDDYVRLYLDKFTECTEYEKKMVWLEGLANIQLGRVVEFLEPIASGSNAESRHFRVLAAWASLPTAPLRPDVIYPVYWPMLINRTEHLEIRIAALTLLIVSSPTPSRLVSLYWYMQDEPNQHLYNFFYTTLKSLEHTTYPCYLHIGGIAAQFTRILRKPSAGHTITTGNYLFDYQDMYRKFGAMLQSIVIANPVTNIPEVLYVTFNNYGSSTNLNNVALYIKAEGLLHSLSTLETPTQVKDILKNFQIDSQQSTSVHLEIIARVQGKTVLCLHLNQTNIARAFRYLESLPDNIYHIYQNMEFHVNQQRINVPLIVETVQVTDLGTNVRLAVTATSLFSMRGNFTHVPNGRNNHVILRSSIHGTEIIENYNPLIDLWHSAERTQSIHGYLPINVTLGFDVRPFISYNTPGGNLRTGITAHARTVTSIRGAKARSKLNKICPTCPTLYTVTNLASNQHKTTNILDADIGELGGQLHVKTFDCENSISHQKMVTDVLSAFRGNYQIFSIMRFPLMGIHLLDYFTYIPPKGSCGLAAYIETFDRPRSQVKVEYVNSGSQHMLSLTHRELESLKVLHQWNIAVLYEITSWISDSIKVKATKSTPGEKVMKVCLEAEKDMPWEWDFLSTKPVNPAQLKVNIVWGVSDTAKGKCIGSSIFLNLSGEVTQQQIDESKQARWPYHQCQLESEGKKSIPYTDACFESSKELSTLRKYDVFLEYKHLPEYLAKYAWRLRAFYDLIGGNSSTGTNSDQFTVSAVFPKDSDVGSLKVNNNEINVEYDYNVIDYFLTRTRIHKYVDLPVVHSFLSTCVVTPGLVKSVHNITMPIKKNHEVLLLGDCYDDNPRFALTAKSTPDGITVDFSDETGFIKISHFEGGGSIHNSTTHIPLQRNFVFQTLNSKRVRLDDRSVDLIVPSILLFVHWTQEQTLLFFPNYLLEFSCGVCATNHSDINTLYQRLII